ncbi:MAG: [protein-PII] uridylyltransferase [Rhodospirillales bacterium]|nr:[protein-PII] uridylyltransferase [Rhodospirillales bacterium]
MSKIRKHREIIERKALITELEELVNWSGYNNKTRGQVLTIFKKALNKGQDEVRRRFEEGEAKGLETVKAHSFLLDQIVRTLHDFALTHAYPRSNPTAAEQLTICAVGGYGRGTLAPQSDLDLMFLLPYKQTPHVEQVVEFMLYMLWDMGLKVGHSTRTIDECIRLAKQDSTIKTALLDTRWLWGGQELYEAFKKRYSEDVIKGTGLDFVDTKLKERDTRHEKMGDTRYVLEPNIKEGKGGQRDVQTLFWMAKYLYEVDTMNELVSLGVLTKSDSKRFHKVSNFLWTVRCHLHYLTGRPEERLAFDVQTSLAERMNYRDSAKAKGVERFMKHYFLIAKEVGELTRLLCAVLEDEQKKSKRRFRFSLEVLRRRNLEGFKMDGDRLTMASEDQFEADPAAILRLFRVAQINDLDIHPTAFRYVAQNLKGFNRKARRDPEANEIFLQILTSENDPATSLMRLNEVGVLGKFIPDFGRVVAQMQYDMYHVYTVDEHTIRAIRILHRIESGHYSEDMPISSEVIKDIISRRVLYCAVLIHDIAKGRGGDHSVLGAEVAQKLCPRLGLNEEETESVAWLVRNHLGMSHTAFKRDVEDSKTISDFASVVQSPERLKMLLLLTVSDIRAVGPNVWNAWKAGLLRDLYMLTMDRLTGEFKAARQDVRVQRAQDALRAQMTDCTEEELEEFIESGYASFWLSTDTDTHERYARMIYKAKKQNKDTLIESRPCPELAATEITVYSTDHPGLFSRIAGAMALSNASILDARVVTMKDGMALDTFIIQDANNQIFDNERQLTKLCERIEQSLDGTIHPAHELEKAKKSTLPSRMGIFKVAPRVLIDNKASRSHTVIEINGRDRLGFLHDVTNALSDLGMQINSARISTYGERVVDVFYVKDIFGLKVENTSKLNTIKEKILKAISVPKKTKKKSAGKEAA